LKKSSDYLSSILTFTLECPELEPFDRNDGHDYNDYNINNINNENYDINNKQDDGIENNDTHLNNGNSKGGTYQYRFV
jgi:hypothetical protein